jgi:hypothetical protein
VLDQLALGDLVALVLAPGELALLELERILGRGRSLFDVVLVDLVDFGGVLHELQLGLGRGLLGQGIWKRPLLHRARGIGLEKNALDPVNPPTEGARFFLCNRRAKL